MKVLRILWLVLVPVSVMPAYAGEGDVLALARLWSEVRAIHPALADGSVDWDRALVEALPALQGADNDASLRRAAATLMAPLHDSSLRIAEDDATFVRWPADGPVLEWLPRDTALLHLHFGMQAGAAPFVLPARARRVILDLRPISTPPGLEQPPTQLLAVLSQLISVPLLPPATRYRFSTGPRPEDPQQWEGFKPGFVQMEVQRLLPAAGARALPIVVIVNDTQSVPGIVLTLQKAGLARIVAEEGRWHSRASPMQTLWLKADLPVEFAAGQLAWPDGSVASLHADVTLPEDRATGQGSAAVTAALIQLATPARAVGKTAASQAAIYPVRHDDERYREMRFPQREWRMLAAIKLWATMDQYFPARQLMTASWDEALRSCLRRMEGVHDAREYGLALQAMAANLDDSHVGVYSRALGFNDLTAFIGVRLARIDGHIVAAAVRASSLERSGLLHPGDEILGIDGEDVAVRLARLATMISASTEAGRWRNAMDEMLIVPAGSSVNLLVAGADGEKRKVTVPSTPWEDELPLRHERPVVAVEQGVAYVDLARLLPSEVDAMFKTIKKSRALILDMRGYPNRTGRAIARRLNVLHAASFGTSYQALALPQQVATGVQFAYADRLYPATAPLYRGKVVMLINEYTQSQAEHLALMVEAATPVTFIGTPSAGANGDLRWVVLPGNVSVSYSGLEVRHADGRQLQRVGVQPHIVVAPSVAGLRAGRDEVLQRAQDFLHQDQE